MPKYYHRLGGLPKRTNKRNKYKVVLYCNQKKQKVFYKSRVIYPARKKYRELLVNNNVYFPKRWNWLGKPLNYELLLLGNYGEALEKYKAASGVVYNIGKTSSGFFVKDIQPYDIEEKFKYYNIDKMIVFRDLIKVMMKETYSKTIMAIHNKLMIEIFETEDIHLFVLKNKKGAERLYDTIKKFYYENKMSDCFFFTKPAGHKDLDVIFSKIESSTGMSRSEINKISTR